MTSDWSSFHPLTIPCFLHFPYHVGVCIINDRALTREQINLNLPNTYDLLCSTVLVCVLYFCFVFLMLFCSVGCFFLGLNSFHDAEIYWESVPNIYTVYTTILSHLWLLTCCRTLSQQTPLFASVLTCWNLNLHTLHNCDSNCNPFIELTDPASRHFLSGCNCCLGCLYRTIRLSRKLFTWDHLNW